MSHFARAPLRRRRRSHQTFSVRGSNLERRAFVRRFLRRMISVGDCVTIRPSPNGAICDKVADDQRRLMIG